MLIEHRGVAPSVAESAYIAPTAVVCGDVETGEDCRIMFGAVLVAEDAPVRVGARTVIMENAVVRAWPQLPVSIGTDVMIGPGANVNGAEVDHDAFIAAGASLFPAAQIGARAVVRTNGVVHVNSELPPGRAVPEGWTAIGRPAEVVPPGEDERMLFSLYGVNFTKAVFGESRAEVGMTNYLELFGAHRDDRPSSEGRLPSAACTAESGGSYPSSAKRATASIRSCCPLSTASVFASRSSSARSWSPASQPNCFRRRRHRRSAIRRRLGGRLDQPRLSTLFALLLVGIAVLLVIESARTLV
jgi:carbonic anhydrase/acetyltransferase-like protein (isoleucine patch superfamily)